jgi:hypothetical protein
MIWAVVCFLITTRRLRFGSAEAGAGASVEGMDEDERAAEVVVSVDRVVTNRRERRPFVEGAGLAMMREEEEEVEELAGDSCRSQGRGGVFFGGMGLVKSLMVRLGGAVGFGELTGESAGVLVALLRVRVDLRMADGGATGAAVSEGTVADWRAESVDGGGRLERFLGGRDDSGLTLRKKEYETSKVQRETKRGRTILQR